MLNQEQIMNNWNQVKGGVRNLWGQISDEELEKTKGSIPAISGLVQQKYGESKEVIKDKLDQLMGSFDNKTDKYNLGAKASFERNPVQERTSSASQNQDSLRDPKTRSRERSSFDNDSYSASQESLHDTQGTSNNSYQNPNRERIDKDAHQ